MKLITVFRYEWKHFEIAFEKYDDIFQIGFVLVRHKHFSESKLNHWHTIFDFGKYYLELTFGDSHGDEE